MLKVRSNEASDDLCMLDKKRCHNEEPRSPLGGERQALELYVAGVSVAIQV